MHHHEETLTEWLGEQWALLRFEITSTSLSLIRYRLVTTLKDEAD